MKNKTANILIHLLGRRNTWRLSRNLYLHARADSINDAQFNGEELLQRHLLARFVATQDNLVAFDIGANIGDWTYFILAESDRLNLKGKIDVHSFEPTPNTFLALQRRINNLKLRDAAHLVQKALSSSDGTADLFVAGETAGTNSLHQDSNTETKARIQINKMTMHAYCGSNNIEMIHFVKCDTEGHDMEVLAGAKKLFDEQRIMACQFEYNHRWVYSRHYLKDVFDMFENTPYRIGKITPNKIEFYQAWHPELERFFEGNYIVIHSAAHDWFSSVTGDFDASNTYCTYEH